MADAADDHVPVAAAIQRKLHVIVAAAVRRKPQPSAGRRNGKQVALRLQCVCQHSRRRRCHLFEKEGVRAFGVGGVLTPLLRARFRAIDGMHELLANVGDFHVCLVKLIVGD